MSDDLTAVARRIATDAHAGQVDKLGQPYIGHVSRVAGRVQTEDQQVVAWLHDVLEDTTVTAGDLTAAGIPDRLIRGVEAITHRRHEPRVDYYARVRTDEIAVAVKLADIADNADPTRLALLDQATRERLTEKYRKARAAVTGHNPVTDTQRWGRSMRLAPGEDWRAGNDARRIPGPLACRRGQCPVVVLGSDLADARHRGDPPPRGGNCPRGEYAVAASAR